jgi:hypothetical protein
VVDEAIFSKQKAPEFSLVKTPDRCYKMASLHQSRTSSEGISTDTPFKYVNEAQVSRDSHSPCPPKSNIFGRVNWIRCLHGPNVEVSFRIERIRGVTDTTYCAFIGESQEREDILWAKKWHQSTSSQYTISLNADDLDVAREARTHG